MTCFAQQSPVRKFGIELNYGSRDALYKLALLLDSKEKITEYYDYHGIEFGVADIAHYNIASHCLFTPDEFVFTDSTHSDEFLSFLKNNDKRIVFDHLCNCFLITPLDQRNFIFETRMMNSERMKELRNELPLTSVFQWMKDCGVDSLVSQKNPRCLLIIASELYSDLRQIGYLQPDHTELLELLQLLTGTQLGLINENKKITYVDANATSEILLNQLIFYSKYFSSYVWDETKSHFVMPGQKVLLLPVEEELIQLLNSKDISVVNDAILQLSTCNSENVYSLLIKYKDKNRRYGNSFSIYPYQSLQIALLISDFCKKNQIEWELTSDLQEDIQTLGKSNDYADRYRLENEILKKLTLDNITAFEREVLLNEFLYYRNLSVGRILDIFYSEHWNELVHSPKYLACYLKKSAIFKQYGLGGYSSNYLVKFSGSSDELLCILDTFCTIDLQIKQQIDEIVRLNQKQKRNILYQENIQSIDNKDYVLENFKHKLEWVTGRDSLTNKSDDLISKLMSMICYEQIGLSLGAIKNYPFVSEWKKYRFMERDWGLFTNSDFNIKYNRALFLGIYEACTEYELYEYYLDNAQIDYKTQDGNLDYDKIYNILKYDHYRGYVSSGSDGVNHVYSVVKLLEIIFHTTLGFSRKFCNSNNTFVCSAFSRSEVWMNFLKTNGFLKKAHDEPVSFHCDLE